MLLVHFVKLIQNGLGTNIVALSLKEECDGSLLGVRCLEIGGSDAKEMALLQGH